jgi:hypothetical protein
VESAQRPLAFRVKFTIGDYHLLKAKAKKVIANRKLASGALRRGAVPRRTPDLRGRSRRTLTIANVAISRLANTTLHVPGISLVRRTRMNASSSRLNFCNYWNE